MVKMLSIIPYISVMLIEDPQGYVSDWIENKGSDLSFGPMEKLTGFSSQKVVVYLWIHYGIWAIFIFSHFLVFLNLLI